MPSLADLSLHPSSPVYCLCIAQASEELRPRYILKTLHPTSSARSVFFSSLGILGMEIWLLGLSLFGLL